MILSLRDFLLNPGTVCKLKKLNWINFLYLFLIELGIILIVSGLAEHLFGSFNNIFDYHIQEIIDNIFIFMIIAVIIFPIFEEFTHRYYLDYRSKSLLISVILLFLYFVLAYNPQNYFQNAIHFFSFLFLIVMLILKKFYGFTNIKLLVWCSTIFFALFHLTNYENEIYSNNYFIVPILVMPQFIGGFFQAFVRIQYSLMHSILYHGFFNLIVTVFILIEHSFF